MTQITFTGKVRLDSKGEMVCFCYQNDVDLGFCGCAQAGTASDAVVAISVIKENTPTESIVKEIKVVEKNFSELTKVARNLEKVLKKDFRFRR